MRRDNKWVRQTEMKLYVRKKRLVLTCTKVRSRTRNNLKIREKVEAEINM